MIKSLVKAFTANDAIQDNYKQLKRIYPIQAFLEQGFAQWQRIYARNQANLFYQQGDKATQQKNTKNAITILLL